MYKSLLAAHLLGPGSELELQCGVEARLQPPAGELGVGGARALQVEGGAGLQGDGHHVIIQHKILQSPTTEVL